ncbi:polycystin-1-like protein 1 [Physeter macrocephalus]|uniref:Polycystin-1-like protein 1 n=1 Tax=Physeter macrocephalus TaxID=9755 RepID=A0A455B8G9_PHYMC|nr:polycystic kidney disease protein 1-like 1 [Physeter catodon]|eukprot:XP_028345255.1 polycystic kidney disease protein 1-like 1 [Physeter catodon]
MVLRPRALGGKCYLVGNLVTKQLKVPPESLCELPPGPSSYPGILLPFSELVEDSFPTCGPKDGGPETPSVIDPEIQRVAAGGPRGSQEESSAWAAQALTGPRASGWIDNSTRAVSVHFTLYSPPAQLFSSVSLSAEMLPTGGLTPSSLLESVTVFCSDSAPASRDRKKQFTSIFVHLVCLCCLPQWVFLVLNLTHLCFQFYGMIGILLSKSCRYHSEPFLPREPIW